MTIYKYKQNPDKKQVFFTGAAADIKRFDKRYIGQNFGKDTVGFFFTTNTVHEDVNGNIYEDPFSAGAYAKNASYLTKEAPVIYPVHLDIKNPLTVSDLIYIYELSNEDPFDGEHPQSFFDVRTADILDIMKSRKNDALYLDYHNEIFVMVLEPEQISFALSE